MSKVRINLHVYALSAARTRVYHVLHVGFFPANAVGSIITGIDARGLAYHSNVAGQTGQVDVVTSPMGTSPESPNTVVRTEPYSPPEQRETVIDCRADVAGPKLVYEGTGKAVRLGDDVMVGDQACTVGDFSHPRHSASEGRVTVHVGGNPQAAAEYYVSVIGAAWINREDR